MKRVAYNSFFLIPVIVSLAAAQDRAPHGLLNEDPVAFSPSAIGFFKPNSSQPDIAENRCGTAVCSPLALAAQVEESRDQNNEGIEPPSNVSRKRSGVGGDACIFISFAIVVFLAMGVYYAVSRRRADVQKENSVHPRV